MSRRAAPIDFAPQLALVIVYLALGLSYVAPFRDVVVFAHGRFLPKTT